MYTSLIEPYFKYCCLECGCVGSFTLQKLQQLQNRVAIIVTNSCFDASSKPLTQELSWFTIEQLIEIETIKVVRKTLL